MTLIAIIDVLLLVIIYSITVFFAIKLFFVYDRITALKFIGIFGSLNARSVAIAFLMFNSNYHLVSHNYTVLILQFLFIIFFLGLGGISLLFLQPIFNKSIHRYAHLTSLVFGLLIGMTLADIITQNPIFFDIKEDQIGIEIPVISNYITLLRIIGLFLLILIFLTIKRHSELYPSFLFSWDSINLFFNTLIYTILSLDLFILVELSESFTIIEDIIADIFYAFISLTIALAVLIMFYHAYKHVYLQVFWGIQPERTLQIGLIGYLLSSMTRLGPTPLLVSKKFQETTKITDLSLLGISVNTLVIVGSFRASSNESFTEQFLLMPVPNNTLLTALSFTFLVMDNELAKQDSRFINGAPAMFAIIFPSDLTLAFERLPHALPIVLETIKKNIDIKKLQNPELLEQLSIKVIKEILD